MSHQMDLDPADRALDVAEGPASPEVSFVITSFNYARYLRRCIDSAIEQSLPCEVVVVDDGSEDDSWEIIESYGDRVRRVRQPRLGQGAAINAGVGASTGKVVLLMDSDDRADPRRAERVTAALHEDPTADWVLHNMSVIDADDEPVSGRMYDLTASEDLARDLTGLGDTPGSTSGLGFRRSFLARIGEIPAASFRIEPDGFLICAGALLGRAVTLDEPLTLRRVHARQASGERRPSRARATRALAIKKGISDRAAEAAAASGHLDGASRDVLMRRATWWQSKAELQSGKAEGADLRVVARMWWRFLVATADAPSLGIRRKAGLIARDTVLTLVPRQWYPVAWWTMHYGRPAVRPFR